jgi:hypothetical protein
VLTRLALLVPLIAACGCRRDPPPPASPSSPAQASSVVATRPAGPDFENTPGGAARRFMYAWISGNDGLMKSAIEPDGRYRVLFAVSPWVDPAARGAAQQECMAAKVHEYVAGELVTISPPGAARVTQPVPAEAIHADQKLVSLMERNMFVVRREGRWLVAAGPIIETLSAGYAAIPTQPTSAPSMDQFVPGEKPIFTPREQ